MAEDGGAVFRRLEDNSVAPALSIVQEHGYQWVRLRIMIDPVGTYGLAQDLSYVLRMARQAKLVYNLKVLLDVHYSHWWADGQNQWPPKRWKHPENDTVVDMNTLRGHVFAYTRRVMEVLKEEQVLPDAVQIGNEISSGMLWEHGKLPSHWDRMEELPKEWNNLKNLIQSGIDAINDVTTPKDRPLIVIHLDTGGAKDFTEHWLKTYFSLGGSCDVIGLSWYPMWHGSFDDLKANIDNLSNKFPDKQVWVVETAYYYEGYCEASDESCNQKLRFNMTEEGQYDFLRSLRNMLLTTKCKAVFYWGSHWSQPEKWFQGTEKWDDAARRALFDRSGRALKGILGLVGK